MARRRLAAWRGIQVATDAGVNMGPPPISWLARIRSLCPRRWPPTLSWLARIAFVGSWVPVSLSATAVDCLLSCPQLTSTLHASAQHVARTPPAAPSAASPHHIWCELERFARPPAEPSPPPHQHWLELEHFARPPVQCCSCHNTHATSSVDKHTCVHIKPCNLDQPTSMLVTEPYIPSHLEGSSQGVDRLPSWQLLLVC